jgi:preprotein translocase subunit SecD
MLGMATHLTSPPTIQRCVRLLLSLLLAALSVAFSQAAETSAQPAPPKFALRLVLPAAADSEPLVLRNNYSKKEEILHVQIKPQLESPAVERAVAMEDSRGGWKIQIKFTKQGGETLQKVTGEHVNERMAVVFGGKVYSAPVIMSAISGGSVTVSGNLSEAEAREFAEKLNAIAAK